jgi:hypothetical protein
MCLKDDCSDTNYNYVWIIYESGIYSAFDKCISMSIFNKKLEIDNYLLCGRNITMSTTALKFKILPHTDYSDSKRVIYITSIDTMYYVKVNGDDVTCSMTNDINDATIFTVK